MTDGERDLWRSVYAASWNGTGYVVAPGLVGDDARARWAAGQADRAIEALRAIATPGSAAAEVLG